MSPDYRSALNDLENSLIVAKGLGYTVPLGFDIAIRLMRGRLSIPLYSDMDGGSAFGIITSGEDDEDEHEEMFAFYIKTAKKRAERRRAAKGVAAFALATAALETPRDTDRSGEAGQTAKQAGPEGREPGPCEDTASPNEADDDTCTSCGGFGIDYQTERRCACQPNSLKSEQ